MTKYVYQMLRFLLPLLLVSVAAAAPVPRPAPPDPFGNGYMGIRMGVDDELIISSVTPGYPAEKAGLKARDEIVMIGSRKLTKFSDLGDTIYDCRPGTTVSVLVRRNGAEVKLSMVLDDIPDTPSESGSTVRGDIQARRRQREAGNP